MEGLALMVALMTSSTTFWMLCSSMYAAADCEGGDQGCVRLPKQCTAAGPLNPWRQGELTMISDGYWAEGCYMEHVLRQLTGSCM